MGTRIEDRKMIRVLFLLCWMVYFVTYIGRLNYSSAMPVMIGDGYLTKTHAGTVSMVFFFSYGIGQLVNGFLGDRINSGKMIVTGLAVSAAANLLMSAVKGYEWMAVLWGLNGYAQAMIWPPIVRIFSDRFQPEVRTRCCIHIASTMALGTLAAYFLSALVLSVAGWQWVFVGAALIMGVAAGIFALLYRRVERFAARWGKEPEENKVSGAAKRKSQVKSSFFRLCLGSGLLILLVPTIVHGVLKDGVTSWVPTYITEIFSMTPVFSILVTMVLPVVNLTGAYAASLMNRHVFKGEVKTCAFFFLTAAAALVLLWKAGSLHVALTVFLLSMITSSMMAVNTLVVNVIPMYFGKIGRSSTVSGFLNSIAYLGSAISTFTIGVVVEKKGWDYAVFGWLCLTVLAAVVCLLAGKKIKFLEQ